MGTSMNQYDIDLINFMNTLILSELADCKWLHYQAEEKGVSTWSDENLWRLVNLELSLNPDVDAYEFGLHISSSGKEQESLRSKLLDQATSQNIEYFEKPQVVPEDFLKLLWSWIKDEYEFTVNKVRSDYKRGLLLRSEARVFELDQYLEDEVTTISELLSEECSGDVCFVINVNRLELSMGLKRESLNDESFEIAVYDCSTNIDPPLGTYQRKRDMILINSRRIAASAGMLQGLLSKCGLPPDLPPTLKEWLLPLPQLIAPQDIQFFTLFHELGHRYGDSFREHFGLRDVNFQTDNLFLEELIADLYVMHRLRSHPERNHIVKMLMLLCFHDKNWLDINRCSSDESNLDTETYNKYQAGRNILAHMAISADVEAEISRFFTLLATHCKNKDYLSIVAQELAQPLR